MEGVHIFGSDLPIFVWFKEESEAVFAPPNAKQTLNILGLVEPRWGQILRGSKKKRD